ncbi:MAG: putative membrane protein [Saliniramus fredricksonii]|uniref:Putative membrane protein n=1 Tax=Saliniramus fredricksonii TaxID=1653334 RepID=A0A0P7Y507_9HYPH|nr:hypothetical protein [Saliniramus fredricksonii]KPQ09342.1 MAG: putative membrane protein [Saliniramus fredricksonii]SCC79060.1 hypothetical protein GA0071312_0653 [Saliniramus fredricksonii]
MTRGRGGLRNLGTIIGGSAWRIALAGLAAAALVYLRVLERGEPINPRTEALIALFGVAGALAALLLMLFAALFLRRVGRPTRLLWGLVLAAPVFLIALYAGFAVFHSAAELEGLITDPGDPHHLRHLIHRLTFVAAGYVAVFAPAYLWPWPLPLIALILGLTLLRRHRRENRT